MRAIFLPLILAIVGISAGAAAGWFLQPASEMKEALDKKPMKEGSDDAAKSAEPSEKAKDPYESSNGSSEFVKLNNQFIVPVVSDGMVSSLVVMSLSLEVETGLRELVFQREPKLRDALLQIMFDHANIGGFDGAFTDSGNLDVLRAGLTDMARRVVPGSVFGVLIVDIARQDL